MIGRGGPAAQDVSGQIWGRSWRSSENFGEAASPGSCYDLGRRWLGQDIVHWIANRQTASNVWTKPALSTDAQWDGESIEVSGSCPCCFQLFDRILGNLYRAQNTRFSQQLIAMACFDCIGGGFSDRKALAQTLFTLCPQTRGRMSAGLPPLTRGNDPVVKELEPVSDKDLVDAAHYINYAFAAYGYMLFVWAQPSIWYVRLPRAHLLSR
jgi:hypothetical protein